MFDTFIKRPVLSIVISLVILFMGMLAMNTLPISQFPSIAPPQVLVSIAYPGASAKVLVNSVLIPMEKSMNGVPGMKYMTSDATSAGEATIRVVFNLGTTSVRTLLLLMLLFLVAYCIQLKQWKNLSQNNHSLK